MLEGWSPRHVVAGGGRADEGVDNMVRVEIQPIPEVKLGLTQSQDDMDDWRQPGVRKKQKET